MESETSKNALFIYRLTFGNVISMSGKQPKELQLKQGVRKEFADDNRVYYLLLCGLKMNRKIYQPTEIEAEVDITQSITNAQNKVTSVAPPVRRCQSAFLAERGNA